VVGFVGLDNLALTTERSEAASAHALANAMAHEPRGLVRDVERAVQLMGGNALLAGRHQVESLQPLVQGNVRPLHHGLLRDSEILPAFLRGAAVHAGPLRLVGAVDRAAVGAHRAIRPQDAFKKRAGRIVVAEVVG
jgi:hypothetical protein